MYKGEFEAPGGGGFGFIDNPRTRSLLLHAYPGGGIRVKQVRFGKLALLQQNGAVFVPKKPDFRPFRATFSVKKFGPLLCEQWSACTFGSLKCFLLFFIGGGGGGEGLERCARGIGGGSTGSQGETSRFS